MSKKSYRSQSSENVNVRYWPETEVQRVLLRVRFRWTTDAHGSNPEINTMSYCFIHKTDAQAKVVTGEKRPKEDARLNTKNSTHNAVVSGLSPSGRAILIKLWCSIH